MSRFFTKPNLIILLTRRPDTEYTTVASVVTVTKTYPVKVETSKVVCKTYPSYYYTNKEYPKTETK